MITPPAGVRVYLACGYTDMRKGMATLAMLVQQCHRRVNSRQIGRLKNRHFDT